MSVDVLEKPQKTRFNQGLWFVVALVAALSALTWLGQRRAATVDRVNWLFDYDQAAAVAADSDRLLLLDFTERYCPACQMMDLKVFSRQTVADTIEAGYVPVRVNLSDESSQSLALAQRYRIWATPTLIITDRRGRQIERIEGGISEKQMINWLQSVRPAKEQPAT